MVNYKTLAPYLPGALRSCKIYTDNYYIISTNYKDKKTYIASDPRLLDIIYQVFDNMDLKPIISDNTIICVYPDKAKNRYIATVEAYAAAVMADLDQNRIKI